MDCETDRMRRRLGNRQKPKGPVQDISGQGFGAPVPSVAGSTDLR